jgi:hypothetical protein
MYAYRNDLYVGTCIINGGHDLTHDIGPASAELLRIHRDDSWDLIVGQPRETASGFKHPLSGFEPGFNSPFAGYFWRMAEYDGFLYLGTFDWSVMLPYLQRQEPQDLLQRFGRWAGVDNLVTFYGGFDLFRSPNGETWAPVTTNGFGNAYNFGVRNLVPTPYGLFLGAANPFGPDVAVRHGAHWTYIPNERGGAEVWLGAKPEPEEEQEEQEEEEAESDGDDEQSGDGG